MYVFIYVYVHIHMYSYKFIDIYIHAGIYMSVFVGKMFRQSAQEPLYILFRKCTFTQRFSAVGGM